MAYRQLCAVTFAVLGWVTVGCGSGSGSVAVPDVTDEQPPANPDQPPNNASDRTSNADQPPANPDQPPNDPDGLPSTGGGGGAESQCRAFCDSIKDKDCTGPSGAITRAVCNTGCVLTAEQRSCATEIAAAISCLDGLNGLCTDAFTEDEAAACEDAFDAADACEDAHQPPDDNNNGPPCSAAGGCACGDNACMTCRCQAGTDTDALAACLTGACTP